MGISVEEFKKLKRGPKYKAIRSMIDGINFDSKAEAEKYQELKTQFQHVDCHVPVTLPGGIRLSIDFICWGPNHSSQFRSVEAIEVKGFMTADFKTKLKLFNQFHPLAPLRVLKKSGKKWVEL